MFPIDSENVTFDVWFMLLGFQVKFCAKKKNYKHRDWIRCSLYYFEGISYPKRPANLVSVFGMSKSELSPISLNKYAFNFFSCPIFALLHVMYKI